MEDALLSRVPICDGPIGASARPLADGGRRMTSEPGENDVSSKPCGARIHDGCVTCRSCRLPLCDLNPSHRMPGRVAGQWSRGRSESGQRPRAGQRMPAGTQRHRFACCRTWGGCSRIRHSRRAKFDRRELSNREGSKTRSAKSRSQSDFRRVVERRSDIDVACRHDVRRTHRSVACACDGFPAWRDALPQETVASAIRLAMSALPTTKRPPSGCAGGRASWSASRGCDVLSVHAVRTRRQCAPSSRYRCQNRIVAAPK